jgi:hypothetical protein
MEVVTVYSPVTQTATLDSVLCVSLSLASTSSTTVTATSQLTKTLTTNSRIDLEES